MNNLNKQAPTNKEVSQDIFSDEKSEKTPLFISPNFQGVTFKELFDEQINFSGKSLTRFTVSVSTLLEVQIHEIEKLLNSRNNNDDKILEKLAIYMVSYIYTNQELISETSESIGLFCLLYRLCDVNIDVLQKTLSQTQNFIKTLNTKKEIIQKLYKMFNHIPENQITVDHMKFRLLIRLKEIIENEERIDGLQRVHQKIRQKSLKILAIMNDSVYQINDVFGLCATETTLREDHTQKRAPLPLNYEVAERERIRHEKQARAKKRLIEDLIRNKVKKSQNNELKKKNTEENTPKRPISPLKPFVNKIDSADMKPENQAEEQKDDSGRYGLEGQFWKE
ncbi:MAG: hypothetical protein P1V18_04880 [Candidatus Gracilibacteria bacterium]|nr:hypothetical protein [Candidatus Gracilibacteria bacterium]